MNVATTMYFQLSILYSLICWVIVVESVVSNVRPNHRKVEDSNAADEEDDDLWSSLYGDYSENSFYSSNGYNSGNSVWNNWTKAISDNDPDFVAAKDVSVDAVVASLYFNALAFICLMIFYELLRRLLPAVYSSKKRLDVVHSATVDPKLASSSVDSPEDVLHLPNERPLDWIRPVLGVPWNTVREMVGLDGYFFLRYIRMNVRITAVSTFWIFLIVVPIYFYGGNEASNLTSGWYRISAANLSASSNLMWVPCIVLYFFTGFIFFVIQQEYEHYFNIRQDFLAKGSTHVHPQHHYSVLVENIPNIYQSDMALAKYMESLFPDSVHSAVVVLNVPDLIDASSKCMRSCRRLEKSIAHWHATGKRPQHIVGRGRIRLLGIIDMAPLSCPTTKLPHCGTEEEDSDDDDEDEERPAEAATANDYTPMTDEATNAWTSGSLPPTTPTAVTPPVLFERRPPRGTRVDSISYYTQELAAHSRTLFRMQQRKIKIANEGAEQLHQKHLRLSGFLQKNGESTDALLQPYWFDQIVYEATQVADQILDDSEWDNALITPPTYDEFNDSMSRKPIPSINTSSTTTSSGAPVDYGSISPSNSMNPSPNRRVRLMRQGDDARTLPLRPKGDDDGDPRRVYFEEAIDNSDFLHQSTRRTKKGQPNAVPFAQDQYKTWIRRWLGRLGLDFVVFCLRYISKQWEVSCLPINRTSRGKNGKNVAFQNANIMSRTGFITFLDLVSTTIAVSAPLNSSRGTMSGGPLDVTLAPEPRVRCGTVVLVPSVCVAASH
jgi:Late exocytosis, associated with Golgi transport/Cytosolic domain of 10TM putative phosphate transporter